MWASQVIGNDATVAFAGSQGNLELNVMMPVMARNILESATLLANVSRLLADRVLENTEADEEACRRYAESSSAIVTPLNGLIGYEEAAKIAKKAMKERRTIREVIEADGYVSDGRITQAQLDDALDVLSMTRVDR